MSAALRTTPGLGLEKQCGRCGEWWPADREFFTTGSGAYGLHSWCRACQTERRGQLAQQGKGGHAVRRGATHG